MTEPELVAEIEGENRGDDTANQKAYAPCALDVWTASAESLEVARRLIASASEMLNGPAPKNLQSEILARLSAVTTLVISL